METCMQRLPTQLRNMQLLLLPEHLGYETMIENDVESGHDFQLKIRT